MKRFSRRSWVQLATALAGGSYSPLMKAQQERPLLGMSAALSGPSAALGRRMLEGVQLGLEGSRINLAVLDDGYEADAAGANAEHLRLRGVAGFLACVGTPTSCRIRRTTPELPFIGAFTGTGTLRAQRLTTVYNLRASYEDEMYTLLGLLRHWQVPMHRILLVAQSDPQTHLPDDYGQSIEKAFNEALAQHYGLPFAQPSSPPKLWIERNSLRVEPLVKAIYKTTPQPHVVILATAPLAAARIIEQLHPVLPRTTFAGVSFTGTEEVMRELGPQANGFISTQVVPPLSLEMEATREFTSRTKNLPSLHNLVTFEGYLAARLVRLAIEASAASPSELDRTGLQLCLDQALSPDSTTMLDALGIAFDDIEPVSRERVVPALSFDPKRRQLINAVWPTLVCQGSLRTLRVDDYDGLLAAKRRAQGG